MRETMPTNWPAKTREIQNHHMNSAVWNSFKFRDDDIVIASYPKSGTTWMQQIVAQLIFNGADGINISALSPWVDLRISQPDVIRKLESQSHRRFVKTHLPLDGLVFSPNAKYVYVARDGRDVLWSLYSHFTNAKPVYYDALNSLSGRVGPAIDPPAGSVHDYYKQWFYGDGYPIWSFWENIRSWWGARFLPNVKLVHFNELKRDLAHSIQEIATFLDIDADRRVFSTIVQHCDFAYMKDHAEFIAPMRGSVWKGGAATFFNGGNNGRWRDILTSDEIDSYFARAEIELGPDCATWLEAGR